MPTIYQKEEKSSFFDGASSYYLKKILINLYFQYIFYFLLEKIMSTEKTLTYHDSLADLESLKAVALPDEDDLLYVGYEWWPKNVDQWQKNINRSLAKNTYVRSSKLDNPFPQDTPYAQAWDQHLSSINNLFTTGFGDPKQQRLLVLRTLLSLTDNNISPVKSDMLIDQLIDGNCITILKDKYGMVPSGEKKEFVTINIDLLINNAKKWLHQKYPSLFAAKQANVEEDIHFEPITREQRMDFAPPKPPLLQRIFPPRTNKKDAKEEAVNDMTVGASIEEKYIDEAADGKPYFPQISIEGDSLLLWDWDEDWKSYPEGRIFAEWEKKKGRWTYTTYNGVIQRGERRNNRLMEWEIVVTNWNANDITIRGSFADDGYLKQGKVRVEWFDEEKNLSLEVHIDSKQWKIYSFLEKKHWIGKEYAHYREGGDIVYFDTYEENTLSTQEMDTYFNKIETIMRDLSPFVK